MRTLAVLAALTLVGCPKPGAPAAPVKASPAACVTLTVTGDLVPAVVDGVLHGNVLPGFSGELGSCGIGDAIPDAEAFRAPVAAAFDFAAIPLSLVEECEASAWSDAIRAYVAHISDSVVAGIADGSFRYQAPRIVVDLSECAP